MKNFKFNVFLKKKSRDYILLSTLKKKIFRVKSAGISPLFVSFSYIPGGMEGLFDFFDSPHHHPRAGHSPCQ
jgi:hypothetical protein